MDVLGDIAWNQPHVRHAVKSSGRWHVEVRRSGRYRLSLRRWPEEIDVPINEAAPELPVPKELEHSPYQAIDAFFKKITAIQAVGASISIAGIEREASLEDDKAREISFECDLPAGASELKAVFRLADGSELGAYYLYAEYLG